MAKTKKETVQDADAVKAAKISELVPDDKNFNKGTEYGQHLLEKSLRELGAGRSVLIDKNNRIIAGNKTVENAAQIGLDNVIIVETDGTKLVAVKRTDVDLDSAQGRSLAFADNYVGQQDLDLDCDVIKECAEQLDGFNPDEWGFEMEFEGEEQNAEEDDFDEEQDKITAIAKLGDIWQLGEHRLMCGDSTDKGAWILLLDGDKADMVFTDPPYGVSIGDKNKLLKDKVGKGKGNAVTENIKNDTLDANHLYDMLVKVMTNLRKNSKDDASYFVTAPQGGV